MKRTITRKIIKEVLPVSAAEKKCVNERRMMDRVRANVRKRIEKHVATFDDGLVIRL